jgi:hypothetical protein
MALNFNSFQAGSDSAVFFIDGNSNLIFAPFAPPTGFSSLIPTTIDYTVFNFLVLFESQPTIDNLGTMLVYSHEPATLWVESPSDLGLGQPLFIPVDRNVSLLPAPFQTVAGELLGMVFVLGLNGNLWLEYAPFGQAPPKRDLVDGNAVAFQALSDAEVFVLGSDGNLWLEHAPFGQAPPRRDHVDGNVALPTPVASGEVPVLRSFQALSDAEIFVLRGDGSLWLGHAPFGQAPVPVDGNVIAFQALSDSEVLVLGRNRNLWREHGPFGQAPPRRGPRRQKRGRFPGLV